MIAAPISVGGQNSAYRLGSRLLQGKILILSLNTLEEGAI